MHPILIQAAFAVPLLLLLLVYTATRRDASSLHRWLGGLLASILGYVVAIGIRFATADPVWWQAGQHLGEISVCAITPCFVMTLALYARIPMFEGNRAAVWAVAAPFALFAGLFLTNSTHRWMFAHLEPGHGDAHPLRSAAPMFWVFQVWTYAFIFWGVGLVVRLLTRGTAIERRRAFLLLAAIGTPTAAHTVYLLDALPLDFPLTPATLGVTGLLLVAGIQRYRLLEERTVVRRDVIDHLSDGFVLADARGTVVDLSPAAASILRVGKEQALGWTLEELITALQPAGQEEVMRRLVETPAESESQRMELALTESESQRMELALTDGRFVELSFGFVKEHGDQPAARFLVLRDRTTQRRSEGLLRQRQRLESLGILAAGVAHEVNNPLAFVRANLVHLQQLGALLQKHLKEGDSGDAEELGEIPEIVDESLVGLDRIARIVEGLLRLSRAPGEGSTHVDPNQIVTEAVRYAALHRNAGVQLTTHLGEDLPDIEASADRLIQVILNLLLNAKQALGDQEGGSVDVATRVVDGGRAIEIRVRDDGPGIPEAIRERIFDPFFTTRGPGEGTGLGLSIAYDIVREQGGLLDVTSSAGEGACFTIRLPVAEPSPSTAT